MNHVPANLTVGLNLGGGCGLVESDRKTVFVPVFVDQTEVSVTVDGLLGQLQRVVKSVRESHPDLSHYHLYDVTLRVDQGHLKAMLEFRP